MSHSERRGFFSADVAFWGSAVWCWHGTFRVVYLARLPAAVYVLHAFQKKTQNAPRYKKGPGSNRFGGSQPTRLSVKLLLSLFAQGWTHAQVLDNYPTLDNGTLQAVFAFSADCLHDEQYFAQALTT